MKRKTESKPAKKTPKIRFPKGLGNVFKLVWRLCALSHRTMLIYLDGGDALCNSMPVFGGMCGCSLRTMFWPVAGSCGCFDIWDHNDFNKWLDQVRRLNNLVSKSDSFDAITILLSYRNKVRFTLHSHNDKDNVDRKDYFMVPSHNLKRHGVKPEHFVRRLGGFDIYYYLGDFFVAPAVDEGKESEGGNIKKQEQ